ncbi:MAG TPA: Hsp20/alpha crystallin family protein [Planctomycetes bacterium]|nr:Hsp20/alpha crystallin family protein [Fuerstiella sp.]HIK94434.1 Hsp20/alpha crystallin family protein [Planctomycetota bacterium]
MSDSNQNMRPAAPEIQTTSESVAGSEPRMLFNPPIDIYETNDGLVLYADLPGVTTEGLELQVQDNRLALFGRVRNDQDGRAMLHEEYKVGDFLRSFILSDEVDHEHISARLNNGVLRVELPRTQRTEPRKIQVSTE